MFSRSYFVNRKFWLLFTALFVLFAFVIPAMAQDTGSVIPPDVMTPDQAQQGALAFIISVLSAFAGSALTATIVTVLKLFVPADKVDAGTLKNIVGGVLTILYWLAVRYGFGQMFESIGQFLIVAVPAFVTLFGTLWGSSVMHKQAVKEQLPIWSYKRTP